ncbi:unnamed protein product [Rhizophagus irregularis]|uniref:OTU domain-containing protein n=1 Tax=Rhizophagus irregularis TaxID=588596 RepID=A0A916E301_9GLOM|nr:unnamed protein product [Rhizophagus irregularis]
MSYGQKHKKIQILSCDLSYVDVCISEGIVIDEGASCLLLPDEFNGYIYADTTADRNCLYNAVSYFFIHKNSLSTQLRLFTILELMAYADEYLVLEVFEKDYSYSDRAFLKANNKKY